MKAGKIVGSRNNVDLSGGDLDFYPTPPSSVMGLVKWLEENDPTILTKLKSSEIFEPCVGEGHVYLTLDKLGIGTRIQCSDIYTRNWDVMDEEIDFFKTTTQYPYIVTNPPFKLAQEFYEKSKELCTEGLFLFLRTLFLESETRHTKIFQDKDLGLKYALIHTYRVSCHRGLTKDSYTSVLSFSWFYFERGYTGKPVLGWITKPTDDDLKLESQILEELYSMID
jgi:hypothetical protein